MWRVGKESLQTGEIAVNGKRKNMNQKNIGTGAGKESPQAWSHQKNLGKNLWETNRKSEKRKV